jgi:hypothetical protein
LAAELSAVQDGWSEDENQESGRITYNSVIYKRAFLSYNKVYVLELE